MGHRRLECALARGLAPTLYKGHSGLREWLSRGSSISSRDPTSSGSRSRPPMPRPSGLVVRSFEMAKATGAQLVLLTPLNSQLRGGVLSEALSQEVCDALEKGRTVNVQGTALRHESKRTFNPYNHEKTVILAAWIDAADLDRSKQPSPLVRVTLLRRSCLRGRGFLPGCR